MWEGDDVDLARLPIQHCWPGDVAPLITWGLVDHQGAAQEAPEPGHLPPAGDRAATRSSCAGWRTAAARSTSASIAWRNPGQPFPVAVALGADPATILGAVTPVPDSLSEYQFAGLLRGSRTELVEGARQRSAGAGLGRDRAGRAYLSGRSASGGYEHALEGPYGDHTGYYNEQDSFPVFTIERITMRRDPIYHSHLHRQAAGRAGDAGRGAERSVRAAAAEAVPRDHRLLPAAGRLLLPHGGGADQEAVSRATPSA